MDEILDVIVFHHPLLAIESFDLKFLGQSQRSFYRFGQQVFVIDSPLQLCQKHFFGAPN
jgi:hypothetical protein